MAKRVTLDVDSSIIEKNLLFTEQDSCELDSLFPKQEENAILTKPLPVPIKMSDEVNLELKEQSKNSNESETNSTNLNTNNDNNSTIENLELKNTSIDKTVTEDNTNNDNNSDKTDSNEQILKKDEQNIDNTEITTSISSIEPENHVETVVKEGDVKIVDEEEKKENSNVEEKYTTNSIQNDETHDEIDITLEYDDVDHLLTDEGTEEKTKKPDLNTDEEKNVSIQNTETIKTEHNENSDKQNNATSGRCLWVSGLSHTTRANDLKQHFVSQGRVIGAKVVSNSRSPGARCYGYIVMSTAEEAEACVKNLHHSKLLNRFISVQKAKSDKQSDNNGEPTDSPNKTVDTSKSKKHEDEKMEVDAAINDELIKSESSTSIDKKKDSQKDSPKRLNKYIESSDKQHSKDSAKRRHESREKQLKKEIRDKKFDKLQRQREERDKQRRVEERWRIRDAQRRQREEAARLERERQMLRMERERLQREKMELLRLEKKELEKEREELKRQKAKIEEAARKKHELSRSDRSKKRRERSRSRSPTNRISRTPDIPIKISKKREIEKYKDSERHFESIDKHKDLKYKESSLKDSYRGGYKDRHEFEYDRTIDPKYDRYPSEKKDGIYKPRDVDIKPDDFIKNPNFSSKRNDDIGFEPPPPRISSNDANHFNVLSMSQSVPYGGTSSHRMLRDDFHNKDMFVSSINSSRNVDRVSDRFQIERHERLPNESIDLNHRSRGYLPEMDVFPKQDTSRMVPPIRSDRLDRDNIRVNRDDRHIDPLPIRSNAGRYPTEHERDFHHRDQWYLDRMSGPSKRLIPPTLPARGDGMLNRASWEAARYDQSIRPPGVYSNSKIERH